MPNNIKIVIEHKFITIITIYRRSCFYLRYDNLHFIRGEHSDQKVEHTRPESRNVGLRTEVTFVKCLETRMGL